MNAFAVRFGRLSVTAMLGLSVLTSLGCNIGRMKDERDALWTQNQELQDELNRSRSALDASMAEQAARDAELARLRNQQVVRQAPPPPPQATRPIGGAESFGGIEGVTARMEGRNIEVSVASDILFAPGKADLTAAAKTSLAKVAGVLKSKHSGNDVVVEGHTDADPIRKSKWASNQALSEARAESVAAYLAQQGISRGNITTVGYGSEQPKGTKAQSRRVEIVVMQ